jgi:tetratricopeptide (TPR) repeat protein
MAPNEPAAHRALASILWLAILYHRGAVFTDNYLSGSLKNQVELPKPPPDMAAEFARELAAAIDLSEARLHKNPEDVQAHFDAGTAYALQASYMATVEGRVLGAMRMAKRAYDAEEFVLKHDPKRVEAGLIVGTYRYLVATLAMPARWMAYLVGFGGGKEHGIAMIEDSMRAVDTHVDSRVALLLIYSRERRFGDVVRLARELQAEFPKNRLFTLEEGSAATRAGRAAEGETALTRGLGAYDREQRPRVEGERAVWLYKRAVARVALRRLPDAQADLDAAMRADPTDWTKGRVQLEAGRIADLRGRRNEAVAAYRQAELLCTARNDDVCAGEAARLTKRPFK